MSTVNGRTYFFPSTLSLDLPLLCQQAAAEIKPGGMLSVRDWLLPGNRLRGKKAKCLREAGRYVNVMLSLAGEGYGRGLSLPQYQDTLSQFGFQAQQYVIQSRKLNFHDWIIAANLSANDTLRLKALIIQAPQPVLEYLTPQIAGDRITFHLQEILIIGKTKE